MGRYREKGKTGIRGGFGIWGVEKQGGTGKLTWGFLRYKGNGGREEVKLNIWLCKSSLCTI